MDYKAQLQKFRNWIISTGSVLFSLCLLSLRSFPGSAVVKNLPANAGDARLGFYPWGGNGNPLQYSCLENSLDRGACELPSMGSQRIRHDWAHTLLITTLPTMAQFYTWSSILILAQRICFKIIQQWEKWKDIWIIYIIWKRWVFIPIPKKGNAKEYSNCWTVAIISHASKIMLKFLQDRLQQHVNWELPDVQAGFRKGRGTRDHHQIIDKAREFQKNIYFCFIYYTNAFDCVNDNTLWKILKEMGIPDHLTCPLRNMYAGQEATFRTRHGTTYWFQIGKGVHLGCVLSLCLFNFCAEYMWHVCEMLGWMKHKLESRLPGEISITSDYCRCADDTLMAESEELKSFLMKVKEESEKLA